MPNWFPSWTNCSSPGGWYKVPVWAMVAIGIVGTASFVVLAVAGSWAPGVAAFLAAACLGGIAFCSWWLNVRLICLGGDRSAVGAIYHLEPPTPSLDAFAMGDYDTDFSFNLLLWPFIPQDELPKSFVDHPWSAAADAQLVTDWPTLFPSLAFPTVAAQVGLILPQQTMASLNLPFTGQNVEAADEPTPQPAAGSAQHFLLHCEIEGPGIYQFRILLWVLFGVFIVAAALSLIPIIGPILSWILSILAFLAFLIGGAAIQHNDASPPAGGGWGGSFHPYEGAGGADGTVDIAYVFGRWVYDSLHSGWNELHPLHFMIKIGQAPQGRLAAGDWPTNVAAIQGRLDAQFAANDTPAARQAQARPENRWTFHPLLDGCLGQTQYPEPAAADIH
jgi:hypothetical protein